MLYESLLLLGVLALTFMLPHLLLGMSASTSPFPAGLLLAHVVAVLGAYFLWYWSHGGQTLAMQTWKLQLASVNGESPTINRLLLRYALAWPSLLWFGVGLFWALLDRDHQFLHDRLAGTRLIFKSV
jgi:uncharacterized RDD family membrane protein YckC